MDYKEELEKAKKHYEEELKRRDTLIDELREENKLLIKTSLKQSERVDTMAKKLDDKIN